MPDGEKQKVSVEEEVMSEVTERSMEANMKILVGNEISHAKRVDGILEQSLANLVNNADSAQKAHLERLEKMADAYMEQSKKQAEETLNFATQWHHHAIENNRYTLDRLYSVFPEEAVGIGTLLRGFQEYLASQGWTQPAASKP